ncbi:hypothetical protein B0H16DRAFT_1749446 [Mycena metata]|uniref:Uncharacterized protein n=1 Tax=Mycena metata TaxID=1033252 RepID=A0AAD7GKV3_9AGAR|nr:hypothetical protein B0H16DRAFT_1749446 [Mycena metata]
MARTKAKKPPAASRSSPARERKPTEKSKAEAEKKRKNKKKMVDDDTILGVNWKKHPELSEKLIAIVLEVKAIKQSLFPPCGPNASTTKGGGKPKATAHWELCLLLLGKLPGYEESLAAAANVPADKQAYANKMNNRISTMGKITVPICRRATVTDNGPPVALCLFRHSTRRYNREMGETGAGIARAADIDMSSQNAFTTKWAAISAVCPWYFDMRDLIGQRPNLVPTGLGNSSTAVAPGIIIPTLTGDAAAGDAGTEIDELAGDDGTPGVLIDDWEPTPPPSPRPRGHKRAFDETDDAGSGDDYRPMSPVASESAPAAMDDEEEEEDGGGQGDDDDKGEGETGERKKKVKKVKPKGKTNRKTPAKPTASTPAVATPSVAPKAAKKTKIAEFSEIAKSEERTRQQELEFATLRTRHQMKAMEVKGRIEEKREERRKVKEDARREERMMKLQMKQARIQNAHELRMAATGTGRMSSFDASHGTASFDTHSRGSGSSYSEPNYEFDGFNGNATIHFSS